MSCDWPSSASPLLVTEKELSNDRELLHSFFPSPHAEQNRAPAPAWLRWPHFFFSCCYFKLSWKETVVAARLACETQEPFLRSAGPAAARPFQCKLPAHPLTAHLLSSVHVDMHLGACQHNRTRVWDALRQGMLASMSTKTSPERAQWARRQAGIHCA